jgi:hypothetical protein
MTAGGGSMYLVGFIIPHGHVVGPIYVGQQRLYWMKDNAINLLVGRVDGLDDQEVIGVLKLHE